MLNILGLFSGSLIKLEMLGEDNIQLIINIFLRQDYFYFDRSTFSNIYKICT